ncbi:MAG: PTS sugar transporter subunit IIA [Xanthobacteraceae bacterium]
MKISDFLSSTDVTTDVVASDKQKILEELARKAGAVLDMPPDHILTQLLKREELGSTGMGGGVAIPHARFHELNKPFGMLARLRKPIDFDAVDGNPVDTVFLLLLPDAPAGERLGALACIARKLRNPLTIATLRRARDGAEIYRLLAAD